MIRVVGANPAMDRIEVLDRFQLDAVNRSSDVHVMPGGKGLNVARGVRRLGAEVAAYGFAGGLVGRFLHESCLELGIVDRHTPIAGETRICTILVERETGRSTVLNEPGPRIEPREQAQLAATLAADCAEGDLVVLSGSLPLGVGDDYYATLVSLIAAASGRSVVDSAGAALEKALVARPWMVKVNAHEFGAAVGLDVAVAGRDQLVDMMRRQLGGGSEVVIVTRSRDGLLAATRESAWSVGVPRVAVQNATGSGDLLLAGLATELSRGADLEAALVFGAACGVANAMNVAPELPLEADLPALARAVTIERIG